MGMICPKCHKEFSKATAGQCPITDTYGCPVCRVGLSDGVTDEIRVEAEETLEQFRKRFSGTVKTEERRLF